MMVRRAVVWSAVVVAVACICASAQAGPRWHTMYEGSAIPGPWYYTDATSELNSYTSELDEVTLNRTGVLTDNDPNKTARLQRPQPRTGPTGMTVHTRFSLESTSGDNIWGLQVSEDLTGTEGNGLVKWAWQSGAMVLQKGTLGSGSNSFPAPLGQMVEVWVTIANWNWTLWVKSGGLWTLHSQGTGASGGAVSCLGGPSGGGGTGVMKIDFLRHHCGGPYGPEDAARPVLPNPTNRIGEAKLNFGIGYPVDFPDKMVTNSYVVWSDPFYFNHLFIQENDRSAGVRVRRVAASDSDKTPVGSRITVKGYFDIFSDDVCALADRLTIDTPAPDPVVLPRALDMVTPRVGGGAFGVQPAASTLSLGLNNVGLRVRTCGVVTPLYNIYPDPLTGFWWTYVDDCDGVYNDSSVWFEGQEVPGIKVYTLDPLSYGSWVAVSGNAAVEQHPSNSSVHYQVIYANQPGDVTTY